MVVVRFRKYRPNKRDLEVQTPILRVVKLGDEVEIEFDGSPSPAELEEIARRLSSYKTEMATKKLIRDHPHPQKIVFVPRKSGR